MKTKFILIGLVALLSGCYPINMKKPYFKIVRIESEEKGLAKYYLGGDDYGNEVFVIIKDETGKYQIGDSLMFVPKTSIDTTANQ